MKQFKRLLNIMLPALFLGVFSCSKDERALNTTIGAAPALTLPAEMATVNLQPTTAASELFKWESSTAESGGLVLYEVLFDKEGGDFSKPVYKILSDGGGVDKQATVTHKVLVKIAAAAGINASSTGKIRWTVMASKSINKQVSNISRTLNLQRPAGFAEIPASLYITGSASETGTDPVAALAFKKIDDGVFEIYTSLKAGTYQLTDQPTASGRKFYLDAGVIKEGTNTTTVTGTTKIFRMRLDFNVASVLETTEIQDIGLYMSAYDTEIGQLSYIGRGKWQAASIPVVFYPFSWGRDERYKFKIHTAAGNQFAGSANVNNVSPVGQPASYFYLYPVSNAQWDNTYKFNPAADGKNVKVTIDYGPGGSYTHEVIVL